MRIRSCMFGSVLRLCLWTLQESLEQVYVRIDCRSRRTACKHVDHWTVHRDISHHDASYPVRLVLRRIPLRRWVRCHDDARVCSKRSRWRFLEVSEYGT